MARPSARWLRVAVAAVAVLRAGSVLAFHSGGVGECDGCHAMHGGGTATRFLLRASTPSTVCLNCHADVAQRSYGVLTTAVPTGLPPANYTPGGDFAWLRKSFSWTAADGTIATSPGERHGHNVVSPEFGLVSDGTSTTAPGGSYPSASLSCTSCHDPHGRYRVTDAAGTVATTGAPIRESGSYGDGAAFVQPTATAAVGSYRLLAGAGYAPRTATVPVFATKPPIALSPTTYNRNERTEDVRVAYGAGMSEWCANCHGTLHAEGAAAATFEHVSGASARLGTELTRIYNAYVKTGDLSGTVATSYTSLVPYEEGTSDRVALSAHARSDGTARGGPSTGAETVMCLTCHRAHASAFEHALRWNVKADYVVADGAWPGIDAVGAARTPGLAQGRTVAETRAGMYERSPAAYALFQTTLCNKCHGK